MQGKSAERLQFGAVTEFKGAPAEMSGKWSHVREKLDQETERVGDLGQTQLIIEMNVSYLSSLCAISKGLSVLSEILTFQCSCANTYLTVIAKLRDSQV